MKRLQKSQFVGCLALLLRVSVAAVPLRADEVIVVPAVPHVLGNAQSVGYSPDGRLVAAGFGGPSTNRFPLKPNGGMVVIWEAESGTVVQSRGEYGDIVQLQFTHDSQGWMHSRVFTPGDSVDDNVTCLLRISTGTLTRRWGAYPSHIAAASPTDGQLAIVEGPEICRIYEVSNLNLQDEKARSLEVEDSHRGRCLAFSTDGKRFVAVHGLMGPIVRYPGTAATSRVVHKSGLSVWNTSDWTLRQSITCDQLGDCTALSVSKDGRSIATGHLKGVVRVWNGSTLKQTQEWDMQTEAQVLLRFSPDGRTLAVLTQPAVSPTWKYAKTPSGFEVGEKRVGTTCELAIYETEEFREMRRFRFEDGTFRTFHANRPRESLNPARLAFSPNSEQILVGCNGVILLDATTGKVIRQYAEPAAATPVGPLE